MSEYLILIVFLFLGAVIAGAAIIIGKLLGFKSKDGKNKYLPYECGMKTFGNARIQFKIGYYVFALLFLIFDVEALFLFPILANFKQIMAGDTILSPVIVFIDIAVFVLILASGLAYAWRKGILKWE
ncbi:MAG: NADH-quinone oxidoreductase subunit A [Fibrobacter sp.]|nr:NADH-quinone oxidoreductase subunit A [Fibrobacter sp.]